MTRQAEPGRRDGADDAVDRGEVDAFAAQAERWWDRDGPFRPLHRMNPARLAYIRERCGAHLGRADDDPRPLDGVAVADIGCGGGLVCEPLARLGAAVTGVDAAPEAIAVARRHAEESGLEIEYMAATAGSLLAAGRRFDVVTALEIVEHVADRPGFVAQCCALLRPGGTVILSTLNRTPRAFALAIVGAEYVLRWVPRGTHRWARFVRPAELARDLRHAGGRVVDLTGLVYRPLSDRWSTSPDLSVNYLCQAVIA